MNDMILYAGSDPMTVNRMRELITNVTSMRQRISSDIDPDPRRDMNDECGYPATMAITVQDYRTMYDRESVATRVVEVLPKECWQVQPTIFEDEDTDTQSPFELAWDELGKGLRGQSWYQDEEGNPIWEHLCRADILSGIGSFGVILLGLDDGQPLYTPLDIVVGSDVKPTPNDPDSEEGKLRAEVGDQSLSGTDAQYTGGYFTPSLNELREEGKLRTHKLLYLREFDESLVSVTQYESSPLNPRYGQPIMYRVTLTDPKAAQSGIGLPNATLEVHWSRIIHIADNLGSSEVFGVPRQRPVFNRLCDLRKILGSSGEMYYRGAFPGLSFETHPQLGGDVQIDQAAMQDQMERYMNTLQRYITTEGMTVKTLSPVVVDPSPQVETHITMICIVLGCPKRVFMGSERGELASGQDDGTWNDRLKLRQITYVTPRIIIPFVDRLISVGVLPEPVGYSVDWPSMQEEDPVKEAQVASQKTQALAAYVSGGCDVLIEPSDFLVHIMGFDEETVASIEENVQEHLAAAVPDAEGEIVHGREPNLPPPEPGSPEAMAAAGVPMASIDPNTGETIQPTAAPPADPTKKPFPVGNSIIPTLDDEGSVVFNFNPNHDPNTGEFSSGSGGGSAGGGYEYVEPSARTKRDPERLKRYNESQRQAHEDLQSAARSAASAHDEAVKVRFKRMKTHKWNAKEAATAKKKKSSKAKPFDERVSDRLAGGTATQFKREFDQYLDTSASKAKKKSTRVHATGVQGRAKKPFSMTFKSDQSLKRWADNNKAEIHHVQKEAESPESVEERSARESIKKLSGSVLRIAGKGTKEISGELFREGVRLAAKRAFKYFYTGNEETALLAANMENEDEVKIAAVANYLLPQFVINFNPNHNPQDGKFTSGGRGQANSLGAAREQTSSKRPVNWGSRAAGFAGGAGGLIAGDLAGQGIGGALGGAIGGGIGAIAGGGLTGGVGAVPGGLAGAAWGSAAGSFLGGAIGGTAGAVGAHHVAQQYGGEDVAEASDWGGAAGGAVGWTQWLRHHAGGAASKVGTGISRIFKSKATMNTAEIAAARDAAYTQLNSYGEINPYGEDKEWPTNLQ